MSVVLGLLAPWLGWIAAGAGALVAVLVGMARAKSQGKREGVQQEQSRQAAAETAAKDVVHVAKEDVRAIPATPEGAKQRNERAERWAKH